MKKFINDPENLTSELLEGLALANKDIIHLEDGNLVVNNKLKDADRVTIVTLGGTGHEPAISGFVGEGMVDISVAGNVFAAPGPQACIEAIKMADKGHGVLFVVLNHAGDMLTGNLTMKQVKKLGLNVIKVVTQEDIANAPRSNADDRRGLVGCVPLYKIAGAAAAAGKSLEEVAAVAQKFADNMATIAVAAKGATHPATDMVIAQIEEGKMEIGMGQHGEGGGGLTEMKTADETAAIMIDALLRDLDIKKGEKLLVIVNGVGATTLMEQLIVFRKCCHYLAEKGISVNGAYNTRYIYHDPCHTPLKEGVPIETVNRLIHPKDGSKVELSERCCGESGTFAVSRPDIASQVRTAKELSLNQAVDKLKTDRFSGKIKVLTACPGCLQGMNRYSEATHTTAEFLVVEMMRSKYGDNWLYETVNKLKDGGIEKVLL